MAILVDGMAKILKEGDDDLDHLIAEIGPGACVGEMALVDGGSFCKCDCESKGSTLLVLTVDAFAALGERDPRIWGLLSSAVCKDAKHPASSHQRRNGPYHYAHRLRERITRLTTHIGRQVGTIVHVDAVGASGQGRSV